MVSSTSRVLFSLILALSSALFFTKTVAGDDQQFLVGQWRCDWNFENKARGKFYLTIEKIDGTIVSGEVLMTGGGGRGQKFDDGMLEGKVLKIKTSSRYIELTISDAEMNGFVRVVVNGRDVDIPLQKASKTN